MKLELTQILTGLQLILGINSFAAISEGMYMHLYMKWVIAATFKNFTTQLLMSHSKARIRNSHACMYARVSALMYLCFECMHGIACMYDVRMYLSVNLCMYACMDVYYICVHAYLYMPACMYVWYVCMTVVYACMYVCMFCIYAWQFQLLSASIFPINDYCIVFCVCICIYVYIHYMYVFMQVGMHI